MPSLRDYFLTESADYLERLDSIASGDENDSEGLLRAARALRGAAQMAREDRVRDVASALEVAARQITRGERAWDDDTRRRVRETVSDLKSLSTAGEADSAGASAGEQALARWREVGVAPDESAAAAQVSGQSAPPDAELRRYVATETRGVIEELERAIPVLTRSPMGRDPLKGILRRQRALLGSAGLERYPVVAATLQALEDATRKIARQNLSVEGDWLAFYTKAHVILGEAVPRIEAGRMGDPAGAVFSELRSLREKLIGAQAEEPAFQPPAAPYGGGEPREVIGFFRDEATKLVDRVERMAGAFAAATEERRGQLRQDLRDALNALRDTSRTFGFEEPARASEQALARLAEAAASSLLGTVTRLRETIQSVTGELGEDAAPADGGARADMPTAAPADRAGVAPTPATGEAPVVPIEDLLYRGDAALRRAQELRPQIERALASGDGAARESLDELFDLMRLAMS